MRILGGYFSADKIKMEPAQIRANLQAFQASVKPQYASDSIRIEEYEYGHLFVSGKAHARSMITAARMDNQDLFFSLGYLTLNHWQDWDVDKAALRLPQPLPNDFDQLLTRAEGEFNAVYWDNRRRQLHVINDRFAARPLYLFKTKEQVFFCSNLPMLMHLTQMPVKLDPLGLLQMFMFLHAVDTYTHVDSVQRLRPASRMILSEKGTSCQPYWKLQYDVSYDLNPSEFAKTVFAAFKKSVDERTRIAKQGILALSGGLDSRLIAGCISEPSLFPAYTVGSYNNEQDREYECAAEICRVYGFPHDRIMLPPSDIAMFSREIFLLSGNVTGMHATAKFMRFPEMNKEFCLSGSPGDVMAGGYIPNLYYTLPSRTDEFIKSHTTIHQGWINKFRQFLAPALIDEYVPRMQQLLEETYANASGPTATHKVTAWWMVQYNPAFSCSGVINSHPTMSRLYPHLGYAYNDLMLKLPATWIYKKALYKYMIYQCLPQIRHVCYANTGEYLKGYIPKPQLPMMSYKLWALKRRCKAVFYKKSQIEPQQMFEFYMMQQNQELWKDIDEILASYPQLGSYLNIAGIKEFVSRFRSVKPQDQNECLAYIKHTSFLSAILYFYKFAHEI